MSFAPLANDLVDSMQLQNVGLSVYVYLNLAVSDSTTRSRTSDTFAMNHAL